MPFDPYLGFVPSGQGESPLSAYNLNYDPATGKQGPTGGVGSNPYPQNRYGYAGPGYNGYGSAQNELYQGYPAYTGPAIDKMAQNNRDLAVTGGQSLGKDLYNYANYNYGQAGNFQDMQNSAWDPIAQGRGGYSDEEKQSILNNPELQKLRLSQGDKDSNYLSNEESAQISGTPYQAADYAQGATDQMSGLYGNFAGQIGDDLGSQEASVNAAMQGAGAHTRGEVNTYGNKSDQELGDIAQLTRGAVQGTRQDVNNALDYSQGGVGSALGQYRQDIGDVLGNEAGAVRSYIDPNQLTTSDEYMQNYQVGPQDMQGILNQAGRAVGSRAVMDEELLNQQANANGNVNPMALAAARNRIRVTGGINAGNAMSDAAIKAKQLQLTTSQGRESTRLGAEQGYAGLGTGSELSLGGHQVGATGALGNADTQAALSLGNQAVNAQMGLGTQNLSNEQYMGSNTLGQQNKVSDAALQNEQYLGSQNVAGQQGLGASRLANTQQLLGTGMQQAQYGAGLNTSAIQGAEQQASGRAGTLAGNRQSTNQYNQGQDFTRGSAIYNAGSAANLGFANNKQSQEGDYRGYLANSQNQANQNTTIGNQQRITNQGQTVTGANQATQGAIENYKVPGQWQAITGAVTALLPHAKGGVSKGPHLGLVGEAGPELIIDMPHYADGLNPNDSYALQDSMEGAEGDDGAANLGGVMTGPRKRKNPLMAQILRRTTSIPSGDTSSSSSSSSSSGGGTSQSGTGGVGGLLKLFGMAKGGLVPSVPTPGAGAKAGHHPYGKKGLPKSKAVFSYVDKPQVRMLGKGGPTAVVPLTKRKGNHLNTGDIPDLLKQYGV